MTEESIPDYYGLGDDPPGFSRLHVRRIDPQVRPVTFQRAREEGVHPLVDLSAQPRDLALADPAHPHRLDQLVHRAGGDALDVRFLDHGGEGFLGRAARFEETREVAALRSFGIFRSTDPARVSHSRSR